MRRVPIIAVVCIAFAAGLLKAGDTPKLDFDKGADTTGIVEHARKQGQMRRAKPFDRIADSKKRSPELEKLRALIATPPMSILSQVVQGKGKLPLPATVACDQMPPSGDDPGGGTPSLCLDGKSAARRSGVQSGQAFSPVTGPYEPLPRDNEEYKQSIGLKEKLGTAGEGLMAMVSSLPFDKDRSIPGPVRNALLTRWFALDQERTNLIIAARPLDSDDEALYRFAVRINTWYDRIMARKRVLDSNISEYNRLCLGRQLPRDEYEQCEAYRARGNSCVQKHNASVAENDRLVGVWHSGKKCLEVRGSDFRTWVLNWINQVIKPWIGDTTQALEDACDRLVSVSAAAQPIIIAPRKVAALIARATYADSGEKPCPTKYLWTPEISGLGNLSSFSKPTATFNSNGKRGTQNFQVEASDDFSAKIALTQVTIAGGMKCLVERTPKPDEEGKEICTYSCPFHPVPPITVPTTVPCPDIYDDQ